MKKTIRNILIFTFVALTCGWLGVYIDRFISSPASSETLGMGIWLVLPLLTVLMLRFFAGEGWHNMHLRPYFKQNLKWYIAALLTYPLITALVLLIGKLFGWIDFTNFKLEPYLTCFILALLPNFIKNIFEESVWRGYLTTKLLQVTTKDIWIYILVGSIWGAWHLPYYLYFLPQEAIYQVLPTDRTTFSIVAILSMICWSVLFVELYRLTKSIWPVIILHTVEDSLINHLVLDNHISITLESKWLISPISGLIASLLYLSAGLFLRYKRIQEVQ